MRETKFVAGMNWCISSIWHFDCKNYDFGIGLRFYFMPISKDLSTLSTMVLRYLRHRIPNGWTLFCSNTMFDRLYGLCYSVCRIRLRISCTYAHIHTSTDTTMLLMLLLLLSSLLFVVRAPQNRTLANAVYCILWYQTEWMCRICQTNSITF